MTERNRTLLEGFLGFPALSWIEGMGPGQFAELAKLLIQLKAGSWATIRTLTNAAGMTQAFREHLSRDQQADFAAAEASINKPDREAFLWTVAVAYITLRNLAELVRGQEALPRKHAALGAVREWEYARLRRRVPDLLFRQALKALHADKKGAYGCYTEAGSHTLALALHGLPDELCLQLLGGAVSSNFRKDVFQLKGGNFLDASSFSVLAARDELIAIWARLRIGGRPAVASVLGTALELPKDALHQALYHANIIDLGYCLETEGSGPKAFKPLEAALHPLYFHLLYAAFEGKLRINRVDSAAPTRLAEEILRYRLARSS